MKIEKNQFYNYEFPYGDVIVEFKGYVETSENPRYHWALRINGVLVEGLSFDNFIDWTSYNTNRRAEYGK